ncbi:FadR/GntR family transcriptional regulator [Glacieibacterium frigidum]|uniref:FadR family transcriptional regulator n=1 Tax=Glacieibacterium frigidum TaxID=2593303 RepID=A0A552UHV8_9SPHN|nr:FCD domain-containing protein [Glacieibacterium frigidum]TRW17771.1 FadR family transcriptional regulator [Glacieibacterium frigidum]
MSTRQEAPALRIHGTIARDLGIAIIAGTYAPGELLPGDIASAGQLKVSRTAYREAVRILAAKGLVESRPKAGTRVSPMSRWHLLDPDVIAWSLQGQPGEDWIRDLFELRLTVEPAAAELAARRRDAGDLVEMKAALDAMAQHGLAVPEGQAADQRFHHVLMRATRNAHLISLSSSIEAAVAWTTIFKQRNRALPRDPMPDHVALFDAVAAGKPAAARKAMTVLVRGALSDTELSFLP